VHWTPRKCSSPFGAKGGSNKILWVGVIWTVWKGGGKLELGGEGLTGIVRHRKKTNQKT